ncbi:hypothetical protein D1816_20680 [Aquimarina sp. AD10]|uniref:hypothetical protein n=1 Tax=Aquimarina sp. AD10 TaxID=1714849 RepID=UPI000E4E8D48|nr:hypothetical protein [Aquimarina sp. AD10]AXT62656.1 hypothetical protein D1816_20680 [Aquimarina sp. AD10]RKM98348.1 hypothetical protein D7033_12975 [Aquimarina sp. AD10]
MEIRTKKRNTQIEINSLLENIKPSATKLILDGSKIDVVDVIKLTFFDLILKQILRIKKEYKKAHPRDTTIREYITVETGEKFSKYNPDQFESYFIDVIDENSFYYLKGYLRKVYKDLPSNYKCYQYVIKSSKVSNSFNSNLLTQIFRLTLLNSQGKFFRKEIEAYLDKIDKEILHLIDNNPEEALKIVNSLKGHIFLLNNVKFELFEKLKPLSRATRTNDEGYNDAYDIFYMDNTFDELFDTISDTFESIDDFFNDNTSFDDWGDADIDF